MSMKRFYSWEMELGNEGNSFGKLGFSEGLGFDEAVSCFRGVGYGKMG